MEDRVDEIAKRHERIQRVSADVQGKIVRMVGVLRTKYPGEEEIIMRQLEGAWQGLLAEREAKKRMR